MAAVRRHARYYDLLRQDEDSQRRHVQWQQCVGNACYYDQSVKMKVVNAAMCNGSNASATLDIMIKSVKKKVVNAAMRTGSNASATLDIMIKSVKKKVVVQPCAMVAVRRQRTV